MNKRKIIITILAVVAIALLPFVWIIQLLIFAPALVLACFLAREADSTDAPVPVSTNYVPGPLCFDRLRDVSKLHGCNTRNVNYRWSVFQETLGTVEQGARSAGPVRALDFGAGSLRDTYELSRLGFRVTALDLDEASMREGFRYYDWTTTCCPPELAPVSLAALPPSERYNVITAFDVIEHLMKPEIVLQALGGKLAKDGVLLVTVPNRLTLWERVRQSTFQRHRRENRLDLVSGIPHVQFRTPAEWAAYFSEQGFAIRRHEMGIGFLVNDVWTGFYSILSHVFVEPALNPILARTVGRRLPVNVLQVVFCPRWLMRRVHQLDVLLKPVFRHRWGWNLFVLERAATANKST